MVRIALTADLHHGIRPDTGDRATAQLIDFLRQNPPDLLILAGDVGAGEDFDRCLALFDPFTFRKALVPGNHDIWVTANDARGDSLHLYRERLPQLCAAHGFHYLDGGPLILPDAKLAIVGSMNWYDYSWSIDRLKMALPDWEAVLRRKGFTRGAHNDGRFVRWPTSDGEFTQAAVKTLGQHLVAANREVPQTIVVTHHPPFRGMNYPQTEPLGIDDLLWQAYSGNTALEALLKDHAPEIALAFCGHTHFAVDCEWNGIRGHNIGGDYGFKRLLMVEWPTGTVTATEFHPG